MDPWPPARAGIVRRPQMTGSIRSLLHPRTVAVIGASNEPARIGGRPIQAMLLNSFMGEIYPVNPKYKTVQGLKTYPSISEVPARVDTAIIAVPAALTVEAVRDCANAGVQSAIVFSSGFAEVGSSGRDAQDAIRAIAREQGIRVLGPNCLGAFHPESGWFGTFANAPSMIRLRSGPLGIVSQSGAYGAHVFLASQMRGVGATYWVSTGNEADVSVAEVIQFFASAPEVEIIVAYAEGVQDGPQLKEALRMARFAKKPVIFLKSGRSVAGAEAAATHTASLAGADSIYDALFRQYGVHRARTTEEAVHVAYSCQFGRFPKGRRIGVQTVSGGVGIQLADACEDFALDVPELPDVAQKQLKELVPFASARNPVDFTAQVLNDPAVMKNAVGIAIEAGGCDAQVVYLSSVPGVQSARASTLQIFKDIRDSYPDENISLCFIASEEVTREYEALGYPCFQEPQHAIRSLAALARFHDSFNRPAAETSFQDTGATAIPARGPVSEVEAKRILADAGIRVVREVLVDSATEAVEAWRSFGCPVVLKIASADIPHKTEIGGVVLDLNDEGRVLAAYHLLRSRASDLVPNARVDGVVVAEMVSGGVEAVAGIIVDPVFGPAVMFGLGGVLIEVLKDVVFRLAPFDASEARRMIDEIRGRAVLDGVRGGEACDVEALATALSRLSVFAHRHQGAIASVDINPLIVRPDGVVAVDALIVLREGVLHEA